MWINKIVFNNLVDENKMLHKELMKLIEELRKYKEDSGELVIERLTNLAKKAGLDTYSKEYQDIMHRVFMDIGGRHSSILKGYSQTSFLKDNPDELLNRVKSFQKEASIITKKLEEKQ